MKEELNADTTIVTSTPIRACSTKIMVPVVRPEISPVEKPISSSTHCRNLLNLNPKMPVFTSMFGKMKQEPGVESSHVSNLRQKILNHRKRGKEVQKVPSSPPPKLPKTVVQPSKEEKPTAVIESKKTAAPPVKLLTSSPPPKIPKTVAQPPKEKKPVMESVKTAAPPAKEIKPIVAKITEKAAEPAVPKEVKPAKAATAKPAKPVMSYKMTPTRVHKPKSATDYGVESESDSDFERDKSKQKNFPKWASDMNIVNEEYAKNLEFNVNTFFGSMEKANLTEIFGEMVRKKKRGSSKVWN